MRKGWANARLSEVCTKIQDGAHRSPQKLYSEPGKGRFLYITSKNVRNGRMALDDIAYVDADFHNSIYPRCNPEPGDILLTKDGANTGNVAINSIEEPFSLLSSVCLIKTNPILLVPKFLVYYIQSREGFEQITGSMTGAAIKRIILQTIKSSLVPLPPLSEQRRIVAILDEAFAGLATATVNAEKNLQSARELFDSFLNSVFEEDENWEETTLGAIAEFKNGLNFTKSSKGEKVRIVGVGDFQNNFWVPAKDLDIVQVDGGISESYLLCKGDILTVRSNGNKQLIGRCILASDVPEKTSHSGFTIRIRVTRPDVDPVYLVRYLKSGRARKTLIESGDGAQISNLNQQALTALPIKLLDKKGQRDVVGRVAEIETEADRLQELYERKIGHLQELRQSILQKAFSGELTSPLSRATKEAAE